MAHVNRKLYWQIFGALFALTVLEVGVAYLKGAIGITAVAIALILMAVAKAGLVGLFYMHLSHETKALKLTVLIPMLTPGFYALVLIAEAVWRLA